MIPLKQEDGEKSIERHPNPYNPFMRGVMEFDDYNYKQFNPYILLKEGDIERQKKKPSETNVANATNLTQVVTQMLQKKNQEEQIKNEISENLSV